MFIRIDRFLMLPAILVFIGNMLLAAGAGSDVKTLFDRYQSVYKQYREAVQSSADKQKISDLADKLKSACADYYRSIGVKASFDPETVAPEIMASPAKMEQAQDELSVSEATGSYKKIRSNPFREEFNRILAELAAPDAENRIDNIQRHLEDLISRCSDPEVRRDAIFKLADVVFASTNNLNRSRQILLKYAGETRDPEVRRQACARIRMLKKKYVLIAKRNEFKQVQENAINKWGSYAKTSWLAIPVKIWKLGSYLGTNLNRRIKAKALDKAIEEFDKAVLDTYPRGSADALTRSRIVPLNRVRMLVNGRTSFHYRMEYAKRAQSSIYVQTLLYMDDEVGNQLTDIPGQTYTFSASDLINQ
ncbi:MAG: hypothetical protein Kow0029_28780 [Candidatus Rifleibacteriota bacterium]